jgi:hypothetical protein
MQDTFQSHTFEPQLGDLVVNTNPGCKHAGSEGIVVDTYPLADDAGVVVCYACTNSGDTWSEGDVLEKTMDQLSPVGLSPEAAEIHPDVAYHVERGAGLSECVYRPGSWKHMATVREFRHLAEAGAYTPTGADRHYLLNTRVGEVSHHGGRLVHLDWPEPISEATRPTGALDYIHFTSADHARQIAADRCLLESEITPGVYAVAVGGVSVPDLQKTRLGRVKEERDAAVVFRTKALPKIAHPEEVIWSGRTCSDGRRGIDIEVVDVIPASAAVAMLDDSLTTHVPPGAFHEVLAIPQEYYNKIGYEPGLQEAKYDGRDVELNKPMRGDKKKYKVYVKNDKGNVIKVEFGDLKGGLTQQIQDMDRRRAFGDRHNCDQKDDKTTPGYWSCRLPRYWKELGFKKPPNPNGEWW